MDHVDGTNQRSDDLFFEYARLLGEMQPRAFVAENVAGLVGGVAKGYFKEIIAALRAQGYVVESRLLDAQWLGVPQARRRVIIVGLRADLELKPVFPKPLPYRYSVLDACPWIVRQGHSLDLNEWKALERDAGAAMMSSEQPSPTISASPPTLHADGHVTGSMGAVGVVEVKPVLTARLWGKERDEFDVDAPSPTIIASGSTQNRFLLEFAGMGAAWSGRNEGDQHGIDKPSPSIMAAGIGGVRQEHCQLTDGVVRRKLTIGEVKRLCSFPDDYELTGNYEQQWMRLGNSVPPLMTKAVAAALADVLLERPADPV